MRSSISNWAAGPREGCGQPTDREVHIARIREPTAGQGHECVYNVLGEIVAFRPHIGDVAAGRTIVNAKLGFISLIHLARIFNLMYELQTIQRLQRLY